MSYTRLRFHITFGTKDRQRIITPEVRPELYNCLENAVEQQGGRLVLINGVEDHVHLLPGIPPQVSVETFVKEVKRQSSIEIKERLPGLSGFRWQVGYGGFTVSHWDMGELMDYIRNQEWHHRTGQLRDIFERSH